MTHNSGKGGQQFLLVLQNWALTPKMPPMMYVQNYVVPPPLTNNQDGGICLNAERSDAYDASLVSEQLCQSLWAEVC